MLSSAMLPKDLHVLRLPLLAAGLTLLFNVVPAEASYCEHTSYGRVCHRLSTGARIAVAVSVGVAACFLVLAYTVWRRRRSTQNNLTYARSNAGVPQDQQHGAPPGYYQGQPPPQYQAQPRSQYAQPQYPAPTHDPYDLYAGLAPPYQTQSPQHHSSSSALPKEEA